MKKIYGSFLIGLGLVLNAVLGALITIFEFLVELVERIKEIVISIIGISCFVVFFSPLLLAYVLSHIGLVIFLLFVFLFPLLGKSLVSQFRYYQYTVVEYLIGRGEFLKTGKIAKTYDDYINDYYRMQEENQRREYEKRRQEEEEMWRRVFEQFNRAGGFGGSYYGGYTGGQSGQETNYGLDDFVKKYELCASIIGVSPDADEYEIKLAYRRKAKKLHPDLNHDRDTTADFQKLQEAFDFMNEENVKRYKSLKER